MPTPGYASVQSELQRDSRREFPLERTHDARRTTLKSDYTPKCDSTHSLIRFRRSSVRSKRIPNSLPEALVQLTFPLTQTRGSVSSANDTSTGKPTPSS